MSNGSKPVVYTADEIFCTTKPSEKDDLSWCIKPQSTSKDGALSLSDIFAQPQSDVTKSSTNKQLSDIFAAKDTTATATTTDTSPYTTSDTTTSLTSPQTVAKVNNSTSSPPTQEFDINDDINFSGGGYDDEEEDSIDEPPCKKICRPSIDEKEGKEKCILENFDDHNQAHKTNTKIGSSIVTAAIELLEEDKSTTYQNTDQQYTIKRAYDLLSTRVLLESGQSYNRTTHVAPIIHMDPVIHKLPPPPPTVHVPTSKIAEASDNALPLHLKQQKQRTAKKKKVDKAASALGTATELCPGYAVVGNTESRIGLAEGEHIPCYNNSINGTQGRGHDSRLCDSCYRRKINDFAVYTIEYQLFRMLLKLGHPLRLRRRIKTQLGKEICPDYSYEYKGHPIRIDQDEHGHHSSTKYDVENELLGLERRMTPGANGESTLVIRNNPDNSTKHSVRLQDPRQVVLIDALINKFKEYVDMGHECIQKSMAIYVDYRDEKEYSKHLRSNWRVLTNPHLTSARKKFNDVVHSVHSMDPSDARDGNGKDIPHFVEEAINKVFLAKQADPMQGEHPARKLF